MAEAKRRRAQPGKQATKSVRLTAEELFRLEQAARAAGVNTSQLIREAIMSRCDEVLAPMERPSLDDLIGCIDVPISVAHRTSEAYLEALLDQPTRQRKLT